MGVKLLIDGIGLLKQMQVPIDVIVIPGNHDLERSYYMGSYLEALFKFPIGGCNSGKILLIANIGKL